jgi:hypothetical protein
VIITIVAWAVPRSSRRPRQTPKPSSLGMSMSRNTISGEVLCATSSASTPSAASASSKPATSSSVVAISLRMNGSSSTISTLGISPPAS